MLIKKQYRRENVFFFLTKEKREDRARCPQAFTSIANQMNNR